MHNPAVGPHCLGEFDKNMISELSHRRPPYSHCSLPQASLTAELERAASSETWRVSEGHGGVGGGASTLGVNQR